MSRLLKVLYVDNLQNPNASDNKIWLNAIFGDKISTTWVKNFQEFKDNISEFGLPHVLFCGEDFDLKFAQWLVDYCSNNAVSLPHYVLIEEFLCLSVPTDNVLKIKDLLSQYQIKG